MYNRKYFQPINHQMSIPPHLYPCGLRRCMYHQPIPYYMNGQQGYVNFQNMPLPQANMTQEQPPNPQNISNVVNEANTVDEADFSHQFLNEKGQVDVNKMLSTVGHLAQTVQQVSPVIKQVNDIIQSFRA